MRVAEVVAELMRFDEDAEVVLDVSFDNGYGREWNIFESSGGPRNVE